MRSLDGIVVGAPGPGISVRHIASVRRLASLTGVPIVIHGSRQSGFSVHTGLRWRETSDVDLGVVGGGDELLKVVNYLCTEGTRMPAGVEHVPMWLYKTVEEAVQKGALVVLPKADYRPRR